MLAIGSPCGLLNFPQVLIGKEPWSIMNREMINFVLHQSPVSVKLPFEWESYATQSNDGSNPECDQEMRGAEGVEN